MPRCNQVTTITICRIKNKFEERLLYVGFMETAKTNKDGLFYSVLVVVLDKVNYKELKFCKNLIDTKLSKSNVKGLVLSKEKFQKLCLMNLFRFYYLCHPLYLSKAFCFNKPHKNEIKLSQKLKIENLYNKVNDLAQTTNEIETLRNALFYLYEQAFYILQEEFFLEEGICVNSKEKLYEKSNGLDKSILKNCIKKDKTKLSKDELFVFLNELILWSMGKLDYTLKDCFKVREISCFDKGKTLTFDMVKNILKIK